MLFCNEKINTCTMLDEYNAGLQIKWQIINVFTAISRQSV